MQAKLIKNEKGFTLTELIIVMAISTIIFGAGIYTFNTQEKTMRKETANTQLRGLARIALDELTQGLMEAGYGFPPGNSDTGRAAVGVTNATPTSITFRSNSSDVHTMLATDAAGTDTTVTVEDITGFSDGQSVVISEMLDLTNWETATIDGTPSGNSINLASGIINDYSSSSGIVIHSFNNVTYNYDATNDLITKDGTTVIGNVSNFQFTYFDVNGNQLIPTGTPATLSATDRGNLRRVVMTMTLDDPKVAHAEVTLNTNVQLRNMGT